jgi:hypothetical protein
MSNMTFNKILLHLLKGKVVQRKSWRKNSRIQFTDQRFVILSSDLGSKRWCPYCDDFTAQDWEVVEDGFGAKKIHFLKWLYKRE